MDSVPLRRSFARARSFAAAVLCASFAVLTAQQEPPAAPAKPDVRQRLQVLRSAFDAFREEGRSDAMERIERAMHALEVAAAGRSDEEAQRIRSAAPAPGELSELLRAASRMHAEWNHPDRAEALARLAEALAQEGPRGADPEAKERERVWRERFENHIQVVERARALYDRLGWETNAAKLAHALELARQALRRSPDDAEHFLRASDLDRAALAEVMRQAARLAKEQEAHDDAAAFLEIAEGLGNHARAKSESSPAAPADPEGRRHRLEILRFARAAWGEAEHAEQARLLEKFIHGGELQLSGASAEESAKAFAGLTMGLVIELVRGAADLYETRFSNAERARVCRELAEFYAQREKTSSVQVGPDRERSEPSPRSYAESLARNEALERVHALGRQVEELKQALERVQRELRELGGR